MNNELNGKFEEFTRDCKFARLSRPDTIRGYEQAFKLLTLLIPDISVETINTITMTKFFERLQTRIRYIGKARIEEIGVRKSTVRTYWSKLNTFFQWLLIRKEIAANPLLEIRHKRPKVKYDDARSLRKDEIDKIIAAIYANSPARLQLKRDLAIVHTLLFTGIRRGELLGLRPDDLEFDRNTVRIRAETSKSKQTRLIPMNLILKSMLGDYMDERRKGKYTTPFLFVSLNKDSGLTRDGIVHWTKRLVGLSGFSFHLHRFRHTFAHNLAAAGVTLDKIQKLLGHTDLRMTQQYLRSLTVEDLAESVNKLSFDNLV